LASLQQQPQFPSLVVLDGVPPFAWNDDGRVWARSGIARDSYNNNNTNGSLKLDRDRTLASKWNFGGDPFRFLDEQCIHQQQFLFVASTAPSKISPGSHVLNAAVPQRSEKQQGPQEGKEEKPNADHMQKIQEVIVNSVSLE
jgi:hypothetical protein